MASSETLAPAKKYKNTTTEEDLETSLKTANETFGNVSILELMTAIHLKPEISFTASKPLLK